MDEDKSHEETHENKISDEENKTIATEMGQSGSDKNNKLLWWIIGIAVVLVIGYFIFNSFGGNVGVDTNDANLQAELDKIPNTGEGLIDSSVINDSDDVNLGEDLI